MIDAQSAIQALVTFAGLWLVIRVELRWLRADLSRMEKTQDNHAARIGKLEHRR